RMEPAAILARNIRVLDFLLSRAASQLAGGALRLIWVSVMSRNSVRNRKMAATTTVRLTQRLAGKNCRIRLLAKKQANPLSTATGNHRSPARRFTTCQ